jgi:hypothetical protein
MDPALSKPNLLRFGIFEVDLKASVVVRQNFSRDPKRGGSWSRRQAIIGPIWQEDSGGGQPACAWRAHIYIYIRTGRKSIRTMPLDCNDGVALRVAPVKGLYPKLGNEFCPQVSPSQVRDACGPHDGNERTRRAIASDGVHSAQHVVQEVSSTASHPPLRDAILPRTSE